MTILLALFSKSDHAGEGVKNTQKFDHVVYGWPLRQNLFTYLAEEPGVVELKCGTAICEGTPWFSDFSLDAVMVVVSGTFSLFLLSAVVILDGSECNLPLEFSFVKKFLAVSWETVKSSTSLSLTPAGKFCDFLLFFLVEVSLSMDKLTGMSPSSDAVVEGNDPTPEI